MKKSSLRHRIRFFILLPILVGSLVTALVAIAPIFIQYPSWIDKIMTDIVNDQGQVMMQVSKQVGELSSGFLQIPVYYVVLMGKLMQSYYEGNLQMSQDMEYMKNSSLLAGMCNNAITMNDEHLPEQFNKSMWFYKNCTTAKELSDEDYRLLETLETCVEFDSFMIPILSTISNSNDSRVTAFFYGFDQTGFFYTSPSRAYPDFNTSSSFNPTTREWFNETKNASEQFLSLLSEPYYQVDTQKIGQDACFGVWNEEVMQLAVCIGFNIEILDNMMKNNFLTNQAGDSYSFVMNSNGNVFSYPNYDRSINSSIEFLEFNSNSSKDAANFDANIAPYFVSGTRALAKYEKDGSQWLIAIEPVNVDMGTDQLYRRDLSVAVVMKESVMWDRVENLKKESNNVLIVESIIFFAFLVTMMVLGWM